MSCLIKLEEFELSDDEAEEREMAIEDEFEVDASELGSETEAEKTMTRDEAIERILDSIIPPREIVRDGKRFRVMASRDGADREDAANLGELLDKYLKERQVRLVGLCPIRRELYEECFDELLRQSTLNSAARGALLLRVRDELKMSIAAYESLYESGVAYGLTKSVESENRDNELEEKLQTMTQEMSDCKEKIKELRARISMAKKVSSEQKAINEKRHQEKMDYLRKTNEQLKSQLELMKKK